jgi:hypothetical protein
MSFGGGAQVVSLVHKYLCKARLAKSGARYSLFTSCYIAGMGRSLIPGGKTADSFRPGNRLFSTCTRIIPSIIVVILPGVDIS